MTTIGVRTDSQGSTTTSDQPQVDVRGPRFVAWITTGVLVLTLVLASVSNVAAAIVLGLQAVVFAIGAALGPQNGPYGQLFRRLMLPRLSATTEREPVAPLRFAQFVGLLFAVGGTVSFALSATVAGLVLTGFALFAAFLNAAFGFCLGCQIYPLVARLRR